MKDLSDRKKKLIAKIVMRCLSYTERPQLRRMIKKKITKRLTPKTPGPRPIVENLQKSAKKDSPRLLRLRTSN
jgi:hypothetical protein